MNRKKTGFFSAGLSCILLVFVLLCLITFAVLSLSSARSDQQFSQKLADRTTQYYEAEARVYQSLAEMDAILLEQYQDDPESWPEVAGAALEASGYEVAEVTETSETNADTEPEKMTTANEEPESEEAATEKLESTAAENTAIQVTFRETVQEGQELTVICQLTVPEAENDGFYRIISWQTQNTEDWEADQTLPVLRREDSADEAQ